MFRIRTNITTKTSSTRWISSTAPKLSSTHSEAFARVKKSPLFVQKAYINGKWVEDSRGGNPIKVFDPATGIELGSVPDVGKEGTITAIKAASESFQQWKSMTAKQRQIILRKWANLIIENKEMLTEIMVLEMGKPKAEAMGEVVYGASFIEFYAEEGKRIYGDIIPPHLPDRKIVVQKEPVGVVGCVCPWNFPLAMITRKAGAALAVGCTFVVKPSELTPYSALALAYLAEEAGIPAGVFSVVTGAPDPIGIELTTHPLINKFTFTGSTLVGTKLAKQAIENSKRISLELGGNAPFIVFESADLDAAADGAVFTKFRNTGQTCICTNRILVQKSILSEFLPKLKSRIEKLKVGPGLEDGVSQGPLINTNALEKVKRHVSNAVDNGAHVLTGGTMHSLERTFFTPTLLSHVNTKMDIFNQETFGPVAAVVSFEKEEDAIQLANNTSAGLASYFYSKDNSQCWRVSDKLQYGMVGVNEIALGSEVAPFGGIKSSGVGREGSKYGVDDYLNIKYSLFRI
eukprot:c4823_g1_i2.p1 GENE.c4823_g1_i2~~c4823_g1_i2.p1  ORF type:complete len:532 (+),score=258.07 c4823_g1_i2:47-1597(+)